MTQRLAPEAWLDLCARQHARAMAGDQRAAAWCAKHAPAVDGQNLWAAYSRQRELTDRLLAHVDFLGDFADGLYKLRYGRWREDSPEAKVWLDRLREHGERIHKQLEGFNWTSLTPEQQAPILDALQDLLEAMAEARGLNPAAMTPEQGEAFARAVAEGDGLSAANAYAERLKTEHPDFCLTAGK